MLYQIPQLPSTLKLFSYPQFVQTKVTIFGPHPAPLWSLKTMLFLLHLGQTPL